MPEDITQTIAEDDWAAAMAEQAAPVTPSPAVFQDLSGATASGGLAKDIDFILDIPVLLTVELGRTKIAIKNLLQLAEVEIVADLGTAAVSLRDIVDMKVGDIIPLDIPQTIEAKVDGVPVMECAYGKFNGQYTLRVEKLLSTSASEPQPGDQHA